MKPYIAGAIGLIAVGSVLAFGANPDTPIKTIEDYQNSLATYEQMKRGDPRLPAGYEVHVYDGPQGKGYQIMWEDKDGYHSKGYGPETDHRTYIRPLPSATST